MTPDNRPSVKPRRPDDLAWPGLNPDDLCFHFDEGTYGEVQDASDRTRGQAIAFFASEAGCDFTDVVCRVRYVLLHTRQDVWDGPGRDRWIDDYRDGAGRERTYEEAEAACPAEPPADWQPREYDPCWSVCSKDHPRAIKVWCLAEKGNEDRIPEALRDA